MRSNLKWLLGSPFIVILYNLEVAVRAAIIALLSLTSFRLLPHSSPTLFVTPIVRTVFILIIIALYGSGDMRGFVVLMAAYAWISFIKSSAGGIFAHVGPKDRLCCGLTAESLFGWYYAWNEPSWKRFMPRDRRGVKSAAISSIFWVSVLFIKFFGNARPTNVLTACSDV